MSKDEILNADFSFLKKFSDKKLSQRLDLINRQLEIVDKSNEDAILRLQTQWNAIFQERLSRP